MWGGPGGWLHKSGCFAQASQSEFRPWAPNGERGTVSYKLSSDFHLCTHRHAHIQHNSMIRCKLLQYFRVTRCRLLLLQKYKTLQCFRITLCRLVLLLIFLVFSFSKDQAVPSSPPWSVLFIYLFGYFCVPPPTQHPEFWASLWLQDNRCSCRASEICKYLPANSCIVRRGCVQVGWTPHQHLTMLLSSAITYSTFFAGRPSWSLNIWLCSPNLNSDSYVDLKRSPLNSAQGTLSNQ